MPDEPRSILFRGGFWLLLLSIVAGLGRAVFHYNAPPPLGAIFHACIYLFLFVFIYRAMRLLPSRLATELPWFRRLIDVALAVAAVAAIVFGRGHHLVLVLVHFALTIRAIASWKDVRRRLPSLRFRPGLLILGSFIALIALGTALLLSPLAVTGHAPASFLDALFTATSAACVTGLIVQDTGSFWSPVGQIILICLIEAGGLGIMTLWAAALILIGRRLGMRERSAMGGVLDEEAPRELRNMIQRILRWTIATEILGAAAFFPAFLDRMGEVGPAAASAVFHSISAFCNAGFSLHADSFSAYHDSFWVCGVAMVLIIVGGLGFPVLQELGRVVVSAVRRRRPPTATLHLRLILAVSLALTVIATIAIFHFEYDTSLAGMPLGEKLLAALFQSVTLRTAGFNTVPTDEFVPATLLIMVAMMFVGAAPASTGGGIKVSTLGTLILTARSFVRERAEVEAFGRRIPPVVVQKAIAITLIGVIVLLAFLVFLVAVEDVPFTSLMFEAASAFGTVGLSTGVTGELTPSGRVAIILLMLLGRIGPLTLALAIGTRARPVHYQYPEGRVLVG